MFKLIHAIYENGVLRPVEPLSLEEKQEVEITIYERPSPMEPAEAKKLLRRIDEIRKDIAGKYGIQNSVPIIRKMRSDR